MVSRARRASPARTCSSCRSTAAARCWPALLEALAGLPGLRPAEPGEFSRRAFLNGRLDLTAAEGLADLVAAETRAQARQALRQLDGELGRLLRRLARARCSAALARLEAEIDFAPEEADVPGDLLRGRRGRCVGRLSAEIAAHLADGRRGERLREGLTIAVVGPPNAGKSSLVNRLARRDVAIVTPQPGTTRDVLEVASRPRRLSGHAARHRRPARGRRRGRGRRRAPRARRAPQRADLRLLLFDGALWPALDAGDPGAGRRGRAAASSTRPTSAALAGALAVGGRAGAARCPAGPARASTACSTALARARPQRMAAGDAPLLTRSRHRAALQATREALGALRRAAPADAELALLAEDLRLAARALGRITGRVGVDDILDRIFAEFCIGK